MSLLTPPGTSHRDKENRWFNSGSRVAWSLQNQYHNLSTPPKPRNATSALKPLPTRSILKRPAQVLLALPEVNLREITPEPSDPLVDLTYLEYPVSRIIASDASLKSLIEAYNVLAARLRSTVTGTTDADASWPLFQPLRKNADVIVECITRDLQRAFVDPGCLEPEETCDAEPPSLPSPKSTPKKKKKGMSAEQVKYARDLCTVTHSVIKLLAAVFSIPAIHRVFTGTRDVVFH